MILVTLLCINLAYYLQNAIDLFSYKASITKDPEKLRELYLNERHIILRLILTLFSSLNEIFLIIYFSVIIKDSFLIIPLLFAFIFEMIYFRKIQFRKSSTKNARIFYIMYSILYIYFIIYYFNVYVLN